MGKESVPSERILSAKEENWHTHIYHPFTRLELGLSPFSWASFALEKKKFNSRVRVDGLPTKFVLQDNEIFLKIEAVYKIFNFLYALYSFLFVIIFIFRDNVVKNVCPNDTFYVHL